MLHLSLRKVKSRTEERKGKGVVISRNANLKKKKIAKGLNTQSGDSKLKRNYRVVIKGQCISGISNRKLPKFKHSSPKTTQHIAMSPK